MLTDSCFHVNVKECLRMFPLTAYDIERLPDLFITGPKDMAIVEQLRGRWRQTNKSVACVESDVFVLSLGTPRDRRITRVGGLPFRRAELSWPVNSMGEPLTFVAQFWFGESKDLFPEVALPGDVLLIFCDGEKLYTGPSSYFHFEWESDRVPSYDLVSAENVPAPSWEFITCYGNKFRTFDIVDTDAARTFCDEILPANENFRDYLFEIALHAFCRTRALKNGGFPFWSGESYSEFEDCVFLCSLPDIVARVDLPFPFLNHPNPMSLDEVFEPCNKLLWFDGFIINFFLNRDLGVIWKLESR